jgi:superoxide reductase
MNMEKKQIFKCKVCGLVIEVLDGCSCPAILECCGKPMELQTAQTADTRAEKHVPFPTVLEQGGMRVTVGEATLHPMTDAHYIQWIEVCNGPYVTRKYLKPGDPPHADFHVQLQKGMKVREYCNVHGLWEYNIN